MAYNPNRDIVADRTAAQIERAKRMAVGGKKKRCVKGKSCSATCIAANKVCMVDIPWAAAKGIPQVVSQIRKATEKPNRTDSVLGKTLPKAFPDLNTNVNKAMGARQEGGVNMYDRPSLANAKMNLADLKRAVRTQIKAGNLNSDGKEALKELVTAHARAIAAEDNSKLRKERNDRDAKQPQYKKQNKEIDNLFRLITVQKELIKIHDEKLAKLGSSKKDSPEYLKILERRKNAQALRKAYVKEFMDKDDRLISIQKASAAKPKVKPIVKPSAEPTAKPPATPQAISNPSIYTKQARIEMDRILREVNKAAVPIKVKGTEFAGNIDWVAAAGSGAKRLGKPGAYGAFVVVPEDKLFKFGIKGSFPDGVGVKGGKIGENEAQIIKKAGAAGLGPKLIAAQLGDKMATEKNVRAGVIAMSVVPGKDMFSNAGGINSKVNGIEIGDAFWRARKDLHMMGIAHNDMHPGNIMLDNKGKVRFVDFGLAMDNKKAALAEAIGAASGSDWQVTRWSQLGTGYGGSSAAPAFRKIENNWSRVKAEMKQDGLSDNEIGRIANTGLRVTPSGTAWGNAALTDKNIDKYLGILYDGV